VVRIAAADIGTGARTALTQVAAEELRAPVERVRTLIGDSDFGPAMIAGGSMGMASWSWAVVKACRELTARIEQRGGLPADGLTVRAATGDDIKAQADLARHTFGAQFAEVRVDPETGEVRVPRLLGVFAAGRIVNAVTARSQLIGGMTWGLSMALFEESLLDPRFGDYVNHDLAGYHVAACADVRSIEAHWIDERDDQLNPSGVKGIGEVGLARSPGSPAGATGSARRRSCRPGWSSPTSRCLTTRTGRRVHTTILRLAAERHTPGRALTG
jgi:xanthine dehydrogenase YagR molybdenum-binding subunit